jgi:hypothetical protein
MKIEYFEISRNFRIPIGALPLGRYGGKGVAVSLPSRGWTGTEAIQKGGDLLRLRGKALIQGLGFALERLPPLVFAFIKPKEAPTGCNDLIKN